jgi:transcriptional regulator with XRE-family HTH domain
VLARRRLAAELRRLREERGLRLDDVADKLMVSPSKLSRLETGRGMPNLRDVRDLVRHYELDRIDHGNLLMKLADEARTLGWWQNYDAGRGSSTALFVGMDTLIGYESEAEVALHYGALVVPGLLQTEEYARVFLESSFPECTPPQLDQLVQITMRRQDALPSRSGELDLNVVLHESCLRQSLGSEDVLLVQLAVLQDLVSSKRISLRILPFSAKAHRSMGTSWQHFTFPDDLDDSVICVETPDGFQFIETLHHVNQYAQWFKELWNRSQDEETSLATINETLKDLAD